MEVRIVTESCYGNTRTVAEAVAEGLRGAGAAVETVEAAAAGPRVDADLVIVAAPTHNGRLPTAKTREQAKEKGAGSVPEVGVKEWIEGLDSLGGRVVTISTTTGGRWDGSAAKAAVKALRRKKVTAEQGEDFHVEGRPGPLADGEIERARTWAERLVA